MEKLLEILKGVRSDIDFENETALVDNNVLDSFDIVSIVTELADAYDVTITAEDMEPENFNSAEAMLRLVERLMDEM
ncbi:MAG: acyl carrier protein [Clostridia bacterium]|nr:acyl carrier protein [Clostridia bacterium]MBQ2252830.1 acyl carrier protein [Clostridia bacterium]MBQ2730554.1 acyl carrier protein [Clostridia bacterium]